MTSPGDRMTLLQLARTAVAAHVAGLPGPRPAAEGDLARPAAVFVSLHKHGDLRGCIGHLETDLALADVVTHCARLACSADPRFPSVTADELSSIDIEISILGPMEPVGSPEEIEVGRHGVLVEHGSRRGLLLPQVATEAQWSAAAFVEHTCRKAGLAYDAWRKGARLSRFEAEVFGE